MTRLARWCFTRRRTVLAAWLLLLIVALGTARVAGGAFNSSLSLPGTDAQAAVSVLTQHYPAAAGETDQVVIQATGGATVGSPQVRGPVTRALARVSAVPGIASVASPYAAAGAAQVSRSGTVAFARVTWDKQPDQVTAADAGALIAAAESADGPGVHVSLGGASITNSERAKPGPSVAVGVIAALAILLLVFGGAFLAALTPLARAALALVIGSSAITLLSHGLTVASASTDLAVLIGLGVGVDYGLFIVSRHRAAVRAGRSYEDAVAEAVTNVRAHRAVRGPDRVPRAARPVRARREFPRRPVRRGRRHRRADHRHRPHPAARSARLPRPEGALPPRARCSGKHRAGRQRTSPGEPRGASAHAGPAWWNGTAC